MICTCAIVRAVGRRGPPPDLHRGQPRLLIRSSGPITADSNGGGARVRGPGDQAKYDIDYLVPVGLGGGTSTANMWPAALKGTGFFEKDQLDHVMRDMVCHRELSLRTAQRDLEHTGMSPG